VTFFDLIQSFVEVQWMTIDVSGVWKGESLSTTADLSNNTYAINPQHVRMRMMLATEE
jgi:hypothetical protein